MILRTVVSAVLLTTFIFSARAHVAPAVDENNRYITMTIVGDRLQISYSVYVGENPAAELRATPEWNAKAFVEKAADEVLETLKVKIDDTVTEVSFEDVAFDLEVSPKHPNAFSMTFVGWACVPEGATHTLQLTDEFELPPPGETSFSTQAGPGIELSSSTMGDESGTSFDWIGLPSPLAEKGYRLAFTVDSKMAFFADDGRCRPKNITALSETQQPQGSAFLWIFGAVFALGIAAFVMRRKRR